MRPDELRHLWKDFGSRGYTLPTVEFYGHSSGQFKSFSNFYEHAPFNFTLPESCRLPDRPHCVPISFTEKAIMLCKAGVMGDSATFDEILRAKDPRKAKALGRQVAPWKQGAWEAAVCEIAVAVVSQKFAEVPGLADVLLSTGDRVIAEMTRNDANWGTGHDVGHADGSRPARWRGTNILGWALMETRNMLRATRNGVGVAEPAPKKQRSFGESSLAAALPSASGQGADDAAFEASLADYDLDAAVATAVAAGASPPGSTTTHQLTNPGKKAGEDDEASLSEEDDHKSAASGSRKAGRQQRKQRRQNRLQNDWIDGAAES